MKARQSVRHIPVELLRPHPSNVRDELGDLTEMARSMVEVGVLQPLTVTEDTLADDASRESYLVLAGHRRLGAALLAGLTAVPCIVRHDVDDPAEHLVLMLVENCQRTDLNPMERAEAFTVLRNRGLTVAEIARRVGLSVPTVSVHLRLLELPAGEQEQIRTGTLAASRAMNEAAAARQQERLAHTQRPVGRPKGRTTTPHFGPTHPLADRARCTHRGVPKVGGVGCGPCWEQAIRNDALSTRSQTSHEESA